VQRLPHEFLGLVPQDVLDAWGHARHREIPVRGVDDIVGQGEVYPVLLGEIQEILFRFPAVGHYLLEIAHPLLQFLV